MPGIRWSSQVGLAVALLALVAAGASAQDPPKVKGREADVDRLVAEAEALEAAGRYEKALEQFLRAFAAGRTDPDTRDHIRFCFRNVTRTDRYREPAFQQFVTSLQPADAVTLFAEAVEKIHRLYPDRDRAAFDKLFAAGLDELDRALADPTFRRTHLPDATDQQVVKFRTLIRDGWRAKLPGTHKETTHLAREVVSAAQRQLGMKTASAVVLELLCGACAGLDEYSGFVPPTAEPVSAITELAGYGLLVRCDPAGVVVEAVLAGSWAAAHTRLRKGDLIERVNGKSVRGVTPAALTAMLRSPGTYGHELEVAADESADPGVRLPVPLPSVFGVDILDRKEGIGYVRLAAFKHLTTREMEDAVLELKARGMRVLVIDVRGNPGGLFTAAVDVARLFLPAGLIVTTAGQVPEFAGRVFSSDSGMLAFPVPVVLLIDTKTMSAAEVLAAALKDNNRATLVGTPTFGKGQVQAPIQLHTLDGKSGVLILSVASAFAPRGAAITGGVSPHVTEPNPERQLAVAVQKAVELIQGPQPMPMMR